MMAIPGIWGRCLMAILLGCCGRVGFDEPAILDEVGGDGAPLDSGLNAPVLLFQPDYQSSLANGGQPGTNRNGVSEAYTIGVYRDPQDDRTKLLVNDRLNNRVLLYDHVPHQSGEVPDVVIGQVDFTSGLPNAGGATPNAIGLSDNVHASICSTGELFVADASNHRVLAWQRVPTTHGVPADFVLGQPDFSSNTPGTSSSRFFRPYAAHCISRKLVVADHSNHRILVYDPIPSSGADRPVRVIGQPDFGTGALGCGPLSLNNPYHVLFHEGLVYVADGTNSRILVFDDSFWSSPGRPVPIAVLGQPNLTSCAINQGLAQPGSATLGVPNTVAARGDLLAVSDHDNNRVVLFRLPAITGAAGEIVLGHDSFDDGSVIVPATAASLHRPKGLVFDGAFLWVGDNRNNRVLAYPLP